MVIIKICSDIILGVGEEDVQRNTIINFTLFTLKLCHLRVGVTKFTSLCLLPQQVPHTKSG